MVLLPVVARELRVKARGKATYRVRFWAVLLMLALLFWYLKFSGENQNAPTFGLEVLTTLLVPAFIFSLFIGVLATADCVSSEKREGTLGLLFLTDLKGYDVICGKIAANSVNAFYGLVAILPVMSLSVMMGGVTFMQFVKVAITLLGVMALSLSVGIFVSTCSRNERKAMFFTVLLLLAITCLPVLVPAWYDNSVHSIAEKDIWKFLLFCPGFGIPETLSPSKAFPRYAYWLSILWQWSLAAALIARASASVPHSWDDSGAKKKQPAARKPASLSQSRSARSRAWLDRNPFLWLALQGEEAGPRRVWFFILAILAFWLVAVAKFGINFAADTEMCILTITILHFGLKIWIAGEASRQFSENRSNNTFEFLLSTPLSVRQIIQGQWLALVKQFAAPLAVVLVWEACLMGYTSHHHYSDAPTPADFWPKMVLLVVDAVALGWVGMYLGLRSKSRIRAILGALTLVLLVPRIIWLMLISLGTISRAMSPRFDAGAWKTFMVLASLLPALAMDVAVIAWATMSLPRRFRALAIRQ